MIPNTTINIGMNFEIGFDSIAIEEILLGVRQHSEPIDKRALQIY